MATTTGKKLSEKSTKQEMLEAYQTLAKQLEDKRGAELDPQKRLEEKRVEEAVKVAGALAPENIDREISALKAEIGRMLVETSDKLATEAGKFKSLQKAVEAKEGELQELYGIEKAAMSLAALLEAQNQKRREFEDEARQQREELTQEINTAREEWDKERKAHEAEIKERDVAEKKARDREKEAFDYTFKRDQQALKDKLADEKAGLEKEIQRRKETTEKEYAEREKNLLERERELAELRLKAAAFPKELETTVNKAVKETADKLLLEAKNREELLRKEFEGERNVLATRIELLEKTVKELSASNLKLSQQAESAYQKVQEIAEKSIEGASHAKFHAELQKILAEQNRKAAGEKS